MPESLMSVSTSRVIMVGNISGSIRPDRNSFFSSLHAVIAIMVMRTTTDDSNCLIYRNISTDLALHEPAFVEVHAESDVEIILSQQLRRRSGAVLVLEAEIDNRLPSHSREAETA